MGLVEERYEFPEGFFDDDEDDDNGDTNKEVIEVDETVPEEAEPVPEGPPKRKRGRPRKTEMEIIQDKKAARKKGRTKRTRKTRKKSTVPEKEEIVKFCYTDEKTYTCTCCGRTFTDQKKNFFASDSLMFAGNNKRLPICRSCVDKMYDYYVDKLGDRVAAVRRMCLKFDYYFNPQIVKNSSLFSAERSVMGNYIGRLNITQNAGNCFDDSIEEETVKAINGMDDLTQYNELVLEGRNAAVKRLAEQDEALKEAAKHTITQRDITMWGFGFDPNDYLWLTEAYDTLRSTNVIDTTIRDELVKDYCKQKLNANKALRQGKNELYLKYTEASQKTLEKANLTPKQEDVSDKNSEVPMGVMIKRFEAERPIPEPRDEWKDVDGIIKFITIYFIGHLCKMLGLKNKYSALYEEEMDKYRAFIPEYEESDDDEIFDNIIGGEIKPFDNTPVGRGDVQ